MVKPAGPETGAETRAPATRGYILHADIKADHNRRPAQPALEEAAALALALPGLDLVGAEIVPLPKVQPGMLFGSGKIEELHHRLDEAEVELVLIDGPVSPVQQRNLEKAWGVKLLDRTGLILEIFSDRARTREGVLQVEMAALSYQRTRLVRWSMILWAGLNEADRRAIDEQLVRLRRQLDKVVRTRNLHRAARAKVPFPVVALVGYTNAGKSTLFNRLTGAEVLAKDMLFATLDPTMRKVRLDTGDEVILSDTVGFISDLPTQLVAAFRATLEEVLEADVILHVRDIAHDETEAQADEVRKIMSDLGVPEDVPVLELWNKADLLDAQEATALAARAARDPNRFVLSAVTGQGLEPMLARLSEVMSPPRQRDVIHLPFEDGRRRAWLHDLGVIEAEQQDETGYRVTVNWTARQAARFADL